MKFRPFAETRSTWAIVIVPLILAIVLKSVYRNYVYTAKFNDFGFADTSPNFFAALIIVISYLLWNQYDRRKFLNWTALTVLGLISYEVIQNFESGRTFDWFDLSATLVGAVAGFFITKLQSRNKDSNGKHEGTDR